jgi:LPS sulfotransferase NodH
MSRPASYLLCGTPRTGSTLLCSLMTSTGVLGRPESYFRESDEILWAERFGLIHDGSRVLDFGAFMRAVRTAGTTDNGVFGARVMWGSLEHIVEGLETRSDRSDLAVLERALGSLRFLHLRREDVIGQAVSWYRAEQTGFWQEGDTQAEPPTRDVDGMLGFVSTIGEHNAAWQSWFDRHGIRPHSVTYEQLVRESRSTIEAVAAFVGVQVPADWRPASASRKQADDRSVEWAAALRRTLQARGPV